MLWLIYSLISSFSKGFEKILHRHVLKTENSLAYTFVWELIAAFFLLIPLFFLPVSFPKDYFPWILVLLSSVIWAAAAYLGYHAYTCLHVGLKEILSRSKIFFVLLIGILFLGESLTYVKVIATGLIFAGILIVSYKDVDVFGTLRDKSVIFVFLASFLTAVALSIDKYAQNFFNAETYAFLVYAIPAVVLIPFVFRKRKECVSIIKNKWLPVLVSVILGIFYYYPMLKAFGYAEATLVYPIIESSILISIIAGFIFLKERQDFWKRIVSAELVIVGALLLVLF